MSSIADLFFTFRGDDSQLQVDASKAGDTAGQTLGQRLTTGARVGLVGLGAGAGALFGIASKGGAELTETVAKYRAETGATAAEAEAAQASISNLYKNNIAGFETLGAVLGAVKTNLGLTGDAGEAAAQRILDYAKVTGQDAVVATGQLDDIMDSLNLSYDEGSVVLDQLVASQQKFGGSVSENAAALAKLAPALNAANLSVDDGIGLLNLFAASGIDAADAPAALTKALQKVESPEELQALIDDINATTDPFERAAKASDLFGARAGAKLANALDGVDFQTFIVGADEAGGAIATASEAIDESPLNRLKLALKQLTGPLADVGTEFGPLVLGFTQLGGGKLITTAAAGIGGLAGKALPLLTTGLAALLPALGGTLAAIGSGIGGLIAAAIPIGMALLPFILIAALVAAVVFLINNPEIVAKIGEFVGGILGAIGEFLGALPGLLLGIFGTAFGAVLGAVPGFVGALVDFILSIPGKIVGLAGTLLGFYIGIWATIIRSVVGFIADVVRFLFELPGKLVALGGQIVSSIISGLASLPGKLFEAVAGAFRNLKIDIGPFHISASGVSIDLPDLSEIIPGLAGGAWDVPRDALRMIHEGEMVIPAAESAAIRAGQATIGGQTGGAAGGNTYIVNVDGLLRAERPDDIGRVLRRLGAMGITS